MFRDVHFWDDSRGTTLRCSRRLQVEKMKRYVGGGGVKAGDLLGRHPCFLSNVHIGLALHIFVPHRRASNCKGPYYLILVPQRNSQIGSYNDSSG